MVAVHGLFLAAASRGYSSCGAQALGMQASVIAARGLRSCGYLALEHWLSSGGVRA